MDIVSDNAESALASLASPIGRDPVTWEGWLCLNFQLPKKGDGKDAYLGWVKNIIGSYLQDANGRVFFCHGCHVYIVCNGINRKSLEQAAHMIGALIYDDVDADAKYTIYDLGKEGSDFAGMFFERCNLLNFNAGDHLDILEKSHEYALSGFVNKLCDIMPTHSLDLPRVLLVEDDPMTRYMVRKALKDECELVTAPEGNKVFSLYASYQPDIVFLDINLPDLNGYDVLDWIMNNDPGACVVMFSSNNDMDNIVSCMGYGAKGFVSKPFSKDKLLHYIHHHRQ